MSDDTKDIIELSFGCGMCGNYIPDEHGGLCQPCGWEHSENVWGDQDGNEYSENTAKAMFESGEALEVS